MTACVERLARVVLNTVDAGRLAAFYVDVLGFRIVATNDDVTSLAIGTTRLDLCEVGRDSRPYPDDVPGWSPLFQHCAIVVSDMAAAMDSLQASDAWSPISTDGPERLPPNTGDVTAFKFRDPEGHPLELLAFPADREPVVGGPFRRIDHTAISVADVERSIAFYARLGFRVSGRSLNSGPAQERLDAIPNAGVDVVSLCVRDTKPHLELLGYRGRYDRHHPVARATDIAATRTVLTAAVGTGIAPDPDGHLLDVRAG